MREEGGAFSGKAGLGDQWMYDSIQNRSLVKAASTPYILERMWSRAGDEADCFWDETDGEVALKLEHKSVTPSILEEEHESMRLSGGWGFPRHTSSAGMVTTKSWPLSYSDLALKTSSRFATLNSP